MILKANKWFRRVKKHLLKMFSVRGLLETLCEMCIDKLCFLCTEGMVVCMKVVQYYLHGCVHQKSGVEECKMFKVCEEDSVYFILVFVFFP